HEPDLLPPRGGPRCVRRYPGRRYDDSSRELTPVQSHCHRRSSSQCGHALRPNTHGRRSRLEGFPADTVWSSGKRRVLAFLPWEPLFARELLFIRTIAAWAALSRGPPIA